MPIYRGKDTQLQDERIVAEKGAAETPAYRGTAHHVTRDMQVGDYGNRIPVFTYEVENNPANHDDPSPVLEEVVDFTMRLSDVGTTSANASAARLPRGGGAIWYAASNRGGGSTTIKSSLVDLSSDGITKTYNHTFSADADSGIVADNGFFNITLAFNNSSVGMFADQKGLVSYRIKRIDTNAPSGAFVANTPKLKQDDGAYLNRITTHHQITWSDAFGTLMLYNDNSGTYNRWVLSVEAGERKFDMTRGGTLDVDGVGGLDGNSTDVSAAVKVDLYYDPQSVYIFDAQHSTNVFKIWRLVWDDELSGRFVVDDEWEIPSQADEGTGDIRNNILILPNNVGPALGERRPQLVRLEPGGNYEVLHTTTIVNAYTDMLGLRWISDTLIMNDEGLFRFDASAIDCGNVTLQTVTEDLCARSGMNAADYTAADLASQIVKGYTTKGIASLRSKLEPLMMAYQYDCYEEDYQLKFSFRNTASVVTLTEDDMRAHPYGSEGGDYIKTEQVETSKLPKRVNVSYLNYSANFEPDAQFTERLATDAVHVADAKLEMAFTPDEAIQLSDKLLREAWINRTTYEFTLPKKYAYLAPSDVVTLDTDDYTVDARLLEVSMGVDGRIACKAVQSDSAIYTSDRTTDAPGPGAPGIPKYSTLLEFAIINSNSLQGEQDYSIYSAGYADTFKGYQVQRSTDDGVTWNDVGVFQATAAIMGTVESAVGEPLAILKDRFDPIDEIDVYFYEENPALESVTELQVLNGANTFAIGVEGRWEYVGATTITQVDDHRFTLSGLLRGLRGTEQNIGTMAVNDKVVLLNEASVGLIEPSINNIGSTFIYRALVEDFEPDDLSKVTVTLGGESLKEWAPSNFMGIWETDGDLRLSWSRRSRVGGEWRDNVDVQLSTNAFPEQYTIKIYDTTTSPQTLLRTVTDNSTNSYTYTVAQQGADRSPLPAEGSLRVEVFQQDNTVGTGYITEGTF